MTAQVWAALLGGAAVGAALTAISALLTGWLTRRHENRRWLLDKRLEAYLALNEAVTTWQVRRTQAPSVFPEVLTGVINAAQAIALVSPVDTENKATDLAGLCTQLTHPEAPGGPGTKARQVEEAATLERLFEVADELLLLQRRDVHNPPGIKRRSLKSPRALGRPPTT